MLSSRINCSCRHIFVSSVKLRLRIVYLSLSVNCHVSGRGPIHSTRLSHKDQVSVSCQITNIGTIPVTCQLHLKSCPDHLSNYKYQLTANSLSLSMLNLRHPLVTWHIANKCRIPVTCNVTPLHPPVICLPCIPLSSVTPASPCHLSPLHPPVICLPCIPLSSVTPASPCHLSPLHPPVICHLCIPLSSVTPASPCHLSPLHLPVICHPYIPLSSVIPASYPPVICHTINARQIPVTCHVTPSLQLPFRYLSFSQHFSNSFHFVMLHLLHRHLS
jgi:hypothetical protein